MSVYSNLIKNPMVALISNHLDNYPTPINLSYLWSFGSLAGLALVIQIITGVLLAMHYAPEVHLAFTSVEHIMRDVRGGVALRYIHANGASMFFIVVYLHMFRGLYYGSYFQPRSNLWYSGIIIFFLMMATAFMGYVLPWGQMSFWGATVITNLFSAIPIVGNQIVQLLWGGFSVDNPTLNRFFSLHYLLPFLIAGMAILHLILLHQNGSNNPLGILGLYDKIPFYPYYYVKDLFAFFIFVWIFSFFVIYAPNYMGHPDNYIEANPLVTPAHIVPEWYFLPFYAVLRTIPDKLGGVVLMVLAIFVLALLPLVDTSVFRSNFFKPLNIWFFWYFFSDSLSLGWIGQEIVESPFIEMANFVTLSYFLYFIPFLSLIGFLENAVINNTLNSNIIQDTFVKKMSTFELKSNNFGFIPSIFFIDQYTFKSLDFSNITIFISWLNIIQLGFIVIFLLLLGTRYTRTGEFALLMNRLAFIYVFFNILMSTDDNILQSLNNIIIIPNHASSCINSIQIYYENNLYFTIFTLFASLTIAIFFYGIIDRFFIANSYETEYSIIVLLIFLGAIILLRIQNFIEFIIAIEIVTFGTYILVAYEQQNRFSVYAGVQYFILGSIPSAMLILSISWIYSTYGILNIKDLNLIANINTSLDTISDANFLELHTVNSKKCIQQLEYNFNTIYNYSAKTLPMQPQEPTPISWTKVTPKEIFLLNKAKLMQIETLKEHSGYNLCFQIGSVRIPDFDKKFPYKSAALKAIRYADLVYPEIRISPTKSCLESYADALRTYKKNYFYYIQEIANYPKIIEFQSRIYNCLFNNYNYQSALGLNFNWANLFNIIDFKQHKAIGILLFFSYNLLFKLTAAPFHFWAISIYEKAPISSVTILSIFTKLMVIFLILKVFYTAFFTFKSFIGIFYIFISILTAIFAIIGAFITPILKKFFVYSSMGHVVFMLIPLALFSIGSSTATLHYLAIYILSSFIMWFIIYIRTRDNHTLIFFKQFKTSDPLLGLIFSMLIFSMSGIPPFGGFYVKLDVLTVLLEHSNFYITFILFFCTVASFFYYLRLIKIIYFDNKNEYRNEEILSTERLYIVIVLFLILTFYTFFIQNALLFTGGELISFGIFFSKIKVSPFKQKSEIWNFNWCHSDDVSDSLVKECIQQGTWKGQLKHRYSINTSFKDAQGHLWWGKVETYTECKLIHPRPCSPAWWEIKKVEPIIIRVPTSKSKAVSINAQDLSRAEALPSVSAPRVEALEPVLQSPWYSGTNHPWFIGDNKVMFEAIMDKIINLAGEFHPDNVTLEAFGDAFLERTSRTAEYNGLATDLVITFLRFKNAPTVAVNSKDNVTCSALTDDRPPLSRALTEDLFSWFKSQLHQLGTDSTGTWIIDKVSKEEYQIYTNTCSGGLADLIYQCYLAAGIVS